jgi:hypothetical protein
MKDGGSAFPVLDSYVEGESWRLDCRDFGMSLRDYFAGQALTGLCVNRLWKDDDDAEQVVTHSYRIADAMLAEREKGK